MAVEKALISNPLAIDAEEAIEVSIVNPEAVSIETEDGGVILNFDSEDGFMDDEIVHGSNLAEYIDPPVLEMIGSDLVGMYNADKESRADWEESYVRGLDLLGLRFEDRTMPWAFRLRQFRRYSLPVGQQRRLLWASSLTLSLNKLVVFKIT